MQLCKDSVTLSARALNKASEPVIGSGHLQLLVLIMQQRMHTVK